MLKFSEITHSSPANPPDVIMHNAANHFKDEDVDHQCILWLGIQSFSTTLELQEACWECGMWSMDPSKDSDK